MANKLTDQQLRYAIGKAFNLLCQDWPTTYSFFMPKLDDDSSDWYGQVGDRIYFCGDVASATGTHQRYVCIGLISATGVNQLPECLKVWLCTFPASTYLDLHFMRDIEAELRDPDLFNRNQPPPFKRHK
jgi:hypothetical protein